MGKSFLLHMIFEEILRIKICEIINKHKEVIFFRVKNLHFFTKVYLAFKSLHNLNILHRDLKISKIIIDNDDNINLIGLSSVKFIEEKRCNFYKQSGTPYSVAPECLDFKNHTK